MPLIATKRETHRFPGSGLSSCCRWSWSSCDLLVSRLVGGGAPAAEGAAEVIDPAVGNLPGDEVAATVMGGDVDVVEPCGAGTVHVGVAGQWAGEPEAGEGRD